MTTEYKPLWAAPVGVAILVVLFLCLSTAIYPGWAVIGVWMDKNDSPAWVQAIGSILAIVVSAIFVAVQHFLEVRRQRLADIQLRVRKLSIIVQLVAAAKDVTKRINELFPDLQTLRELAVQGNLPVEEVIKFHVFVDGIPISELDSGEIAYEVISLQNNCRQYSRIAGKLVNEARTVNQANFDLATSNMSQIAAECETSYQEVQEYLNKLRAGKL